MIFQKPRFDSLRYSVSVEGLWPGKLIIISFSKIAFSLPFIWADNSLLEMGCCKFSKILNHDQF